MVCQRGALEAKALLLAASLRKFLPAEHDIVVALPQPASLWGTPAAATLAALDRYGVRTAATVNRISPDYPIGNKIDCLAIPTKCRKIVFLDSDILLLRAIDPAALAASPIAAVPASGTHVAPGDWVRFYRVCGAPFPSISMRTLVSGEPTPPYFNSGMVAVDTALAPALADAWSECALRLLELSDLPMQVRNRFLDQVSLPIAAAKLGKMIAPLSPDWNFPSWSWDIAERPIPGFYHYRDLQKLFDERITRDVFASLIESDHAMADAILATATGATDERVD